MENVYLPILGFISCAAVIIFSGTKLSYYGDKIADLTGMGKAWVGLILMAAVTSLPELITGISAVAVVKSPDLAAGDIFGACVFNLLILSLLDTRIKQPILSIVKSSHVVTAIFGIILLTVAGMAIFLAHEIPSVFWISSFSIVLFGIYLASVFGIYKYEHSNIIEPLQELNERTTADKRELKKVIANYILHAFVVIGTALFLPYFGEQIVLFTGISSSFFGTLFIAAATTLPELAVSVAALRMGAVDMAVGNLLGSSMFNLFVLSIVDVFYTKGSLFEDISQSHLLSVFVTIMMTAVVGIGLLFKPKKKQLWVLSIDTFVIVVLYLGLITYLFIKN